MNKRKTQLLIAHQKIQKNISALDHNAQAIQNGAGWIKTELEINNQNLDPETIHAARGASDNLFFIAAQVEQLRQRALGYAQTMAQAIARIED